MLQAIFLYVKFNMKHNWHMDCISFGPVPITAGRRIRIMRLQRSRCVDLFISMTQWVNLSMGILNQGVVGCDLGTLWKEGMVICALCDLVCMNGLFLQKTWQCYSSCRPIFHHRAQVVNSHLSIKGWHSRWHLVVSQGPTSLRYQGQMTDVCLSVLLWGDY